MIFNIFTIFPGFFESPFKTGLLGKAVEKGIITANMVNIRDFSEDRFRRCDDYPYGGGSGMVMRPEPVFRAFDSVKRSGPVLYTSPGGRPLDQDFVRELSGESDISILCGNYEGVDQRIIDRCVDYEVSAGDYVLSGGEFAALIIVDAVARYVPGFMSNSASLEEESFEGCLLEYPQYTRPEIIEGMQVPEVLISGHHENIEKWRQSESIRKTKQVRPDLYKKFILKKLTGE